VEALGPQRFGDLRAEGLSLDEAMGRHEGAEASVFRRDGDYWTLAHSGRAVRLKDNKGLRYIAHLIAHPDREFHVLDLVTAEQGVDASARATAADVDGLRPSAESEELLDGRSRREYLRRVEDLRAEVEEAQGWGDAERAARLTEELEFLLNQLAGGVGLGGRARKAVSDADRARWAVSKAVDRAIARIKAEHPDLAQHLSESLRTGTFCSYSPSGPVSWAR
jgi:hypothetical protein